MIRYKDKILEDYFIDPVTAIITNSKGEIQETSIHKNGRPYFKNMDIHKIQVHTNLGYKKDYDIHHLDHNKMNNSLLNLVYLTHSEHTTLHNETRVFSDERNRKMSEAKKGEKNGMYGKHHSEEAKKKMSEAQKGKTSPNKGKHYKWITNGIESRHIAENITIPDGFRRGRTINRNRNVGVI